MNRIDLVEHAIFVLNAGEEVQAMPLTAQRSITFCVATIFLFFSPDLRATSQELQEQLIPFETLSHGSVSGVKKRENFVITDRRTFKRLWRKTFSYTSEPDALPYVDFDSQMVIAVFFGETGDVTTRVSITKIAKDTDVLRVFRKETLGNPACPGPPILGQPYHLVATELIKKPEKNVFFELPEQVVRNCN
jgi:hypothetical protein